MTPDEIRKRENDAGLVKEYWEKSIRSPSGFTEQAKVKVDMEYYQKLNEWFKNKWGIPWKVCLKKNEIEIS